MFENYTDEDLRRWIEKNCPKEDLTEEEINQRIIESFGPEVLKEMEFTLKIDNLNFKLAEFLGIEVIPVFFEDIKEDTKYYDEEEYIAISKKFMFDELESIKCLIHEVKHGHQKYCISHKNENLKFAPMELINEWEEDYSKDQDLIPPVEKLCESIEVDAYAFTKYILKEWLDYDYHHNDVTYDVVLNAYINKYFK